MKYIYCLLAILMINAIAFGSGLMFRELGMDTDYKFCVLNSLVVVVSVHVGIEWARKTKEAP